MPEWWKLSRRDNSARAIAGGTNGGQRAVTADRCAALRGAGFRSAKTATFCN